MAFLVNVRCGTFTVERFVEPYTNNWFHTRRQSVSARGTRYTIVGVVEGEEDGRPISERRLISERPRYPRKCRRPEGLDS